MQDLSIMSNDFEYKPVSCWEAYGEGGHREAMEDIAARYLKFLSACKTERETVKYVVKAAEAAGFRDDPAADRQYRVFKGKTVFLARRGRKGLAEGLRFIGAHGDTPRLDLKQRPVYEDCGVCQAKTHYYGGIRKHQWFAVPLALHGTVVLKDGSVVDVVIGEDADDPVFTVPDLLPHLARKQAEVPLSKVFEAEKMNILLGHEPLKLNEEGEEEKSGNSSIKAHVLSLLHERYGITEADLISAEMQAVPAGSARYVGLDRALIGGYGQDDRACVFTALEALLTGDDPEHTQVVVFWDKEEIGSDGATGAKSRFFEYCVEDLVHAWEPETRLSRVFLNTKAISADVEAALDPDHQDVHDKYNAARMGYGPAFAKYTGSGGKYSASEATAEFFASLRGLLDEREIPWQMAGMGKVDAGGGGTVAKELAVYCMDIIDCGPSVLSMHSPFELCSKADIYATMLAYKAFLES